MVRSQTSLGLTVGAFCVALASPCAAQSPPEPIAQGCFVLTIEGEGPAVPDSIRIDLFVEDETPPGGMPNAWQRPELLLHPLDLAPQDGVWIGLHRPFGVEVEISDLDKAETALIIFRRVDDRLEGVPAFYVRDGKPVPGEFTLWATPADCPEG